MKSSRQLLAGVRTRARVGIAIEAAGALLTVLLGHAVVSYVLDRWLHLEVGYRAALLLALLVVTWRVLAARFVTPLSTSLDDEELALAVERRDPALRQALISALEFEADLRAGRHSGDSPVMMRNVIAEVERRTGEIAFGRALDGRRVARFVALAVGCVSLGTAWFALAGEEARIWLRRDLLLQGVAWPQETFLSWVEVDPAVPLRVAERENLRLRVAVEGVVPERVELRGRFAGGQDFARPMDRVGDDRFALTLETLLEGLEVVARGGDGETPPLRIRLVARPRISELGIEVDYPDYMGRDPEPMVATGGDLRIPRGSTLGLTGRSTKPLRSATLVFEDDRRMPADILGEDRTVVSASFTPEAGGEVRLEILDEDDLGPLAAPQLHLRVVDDSAPSLDFETSGIGSSITPNARIPGVLRVRDDYGVASVSANFRTMEAVPSNGGERPPEPPFAPAPVTWQDAMQIGATEIDLGVVFDLMPLVADEDPGSPRNPVRPGTMLSIRFDAEDVRAPEPNRASSEVLNLRVVTRDELIEELTRRQLEQRRDLERVLDAEIEARAELAEILSSTSVDPRAQSARLRTESLGRQQLALAKKTQGIGERYGRIVAEMANNRLFEPAIPRNLELRIVAPLLALAREDLPASARLVEAFVATGEESARDACVAAYDDLIARIRALLAQMERTESIAALVETLRGILRTERDVQELIERLRQEQGEGVFGPPGEREDGEKR